MLITVVVGFFLWWVFNMEATVVIRTMVFVLAVFFCFQMIALSINAQSLLTEINTEISQLIAARE